MKSSDSSMAQSPQQVVYSLANCLLVEKHADMKCKWLLLALLVEVAAAQIEFEPSREISDYINQPQHSGLFDMDGDGDLDVIAAEDFGIRVLWWENDGVGNFGNRREWRWGNPYWNVIGIQDWDLDGIPDLWLAGTSQTPSTPFSGDNQEALFIARANESGSFEDPFQISQSIDTTDLDDSLVVDLNGDNRLDVVAPNGVYYADSDGIMTEPIPPPNGLEKFIEPYSFYFAALDLNADGLRDLLFRSDSEKNSITVLWNEGTSGFSAAEPLLSLDGDHEFENFTAWASPTVTGTEKLLAIVENVVLKTSVLRLYGFSASGTPQLTSELALPDSDPNTIWLDVLTDSETGRNFITSMIVSDADSTSPPLTTRIYEIREDAGQLSLVAGPTFLGFTDAPEFTLRDIDGDGMRDMLAAIPDAPGVSGSAHNQIAWLRGTGDDDWSMQPQSVSGVASQVTILHTGDFDGDGEIDLLTRTSLQNEFVAGENAVTLWLNQGGAASFEPHPLPFAGEQFQIVDVTDIVGLSPIIAPEEPGYDVSWPASRADFLAQTFTGASSLGDPGTWRLEWIFQNDDGNFLRHTLLTETTTALKEMEMVDWNRDGTLDLLYRDGPSHFGGNQSADLRWHRGVSGGFAEGESLVSLTDMSFHQLVDMDQDGDLDLLAITRTFGDPSTIWVENDGSGNLVSIHQLSKNITSIGIDLDGDGYTDFRDEQDFLLGRPGLTFVRTQGQQPFQNARLRYFDLDGDGDFDALLSASPIGIVGYQQLVWWENRGGSLWGAPDGKPWPLAPAIWAHRDRFAMADLDGDGLEDLVVASFSNRPRIEWFRQQRTPESSGFTEWMAGGGLLGHSAGPNSDWDHDQISNWEEFAFGSDPAQPDPNHPGRPAMTRGISGLEFAFSQRIDAAEAGLNYEVFASSDLSLWNSLPPTADTNPVTGDYRRMFIPINPEHPQQFYKVNVSAE